MRAILQHWLTKREKDRVKRHEIAGPSMPTVEVTFVKPKPPDAPPPTHECYRLVAKGLERLKDVTQAEPMERAPRQYEAPPWEPPVGSTEDE